MGKRCPALITVPEPPLKKSSSSDNIKSGVILTDISGKKWRLGKTIGTGGFGEIFLASDVITQDVSLGAQYVAKVESHNSGPLFVEIHCYIHIAKLKTINNWKNKMGVKHLGIPHHFAFGSHIISGIKYRFLIIPRFESDLQKIFELKHHKFNLKTVLTICLQIIDVLQYMHSQGYLHLDIKASNIGFNLNKKVSSTSSSKPVYRYNGCMPVRLCKAKIVTMPRVLRPNSNLRSYAMALNRNGNEDPIPALNDNTDQIYLLDYGLACKYICSDGSHKEFSKDLRRAHAGTILFCSRDAHLGAQSRRSDLECLGYNLIYWLTSTLPWSENTNNPDIVYKKKLRCIENLKEFIDYSFNYDSPKFVYEYFHYISNLQYDEEPDYNYCKLIFRETLQKYGHKDDKRLDFDNSEAWMYKKKKIKNNFENFRIQCAIKKFKRTPLNSNRPIRPILRKEIINKKLKMRMNWSKILMDPEMIIKEANNREKRSTESSDSNNSSNISNLDISQLNPNATMLQIYNKSCVRLHPAGGGGSRGDYAEETIQGYTPAMMEVYNKKRRREEIEEEASNVNESKPLRSTRNKSKKVNSCKKTKNQKNPTRTTKTDVSLYKKENKCKKTVCVKRVYSLRG